VISAQTAMTHLVLQHVVQVVNQSTVGMNIFERGEECNMYLTDEYYKSKSKNPAKHLAQHQRVGGCFAKMFATYYGKRPYFSEEYVGRQSTSICLFDQQPGKTGGQNWNDRKFYKILKQKGFMAHIVGKKTLEGMQERYDKVLGRLSPQIRTEVNTTPTSIYSRCVKPFL
jgi:hypothetical protein